MKKIMFLAMMVLALAAVTAYAGEGGMWASHSGKLPHNGITVFCEGPVAFDSVPLTTGFAKNLYAEGSAAGGWREEAMTEPYTYNGVTIFSERANDFDSLPLVAGEMTGAIEEGSAAGGLHEEAVTLPENGITIFSNEPVFYDNAPVTW